MSTRLTPITFMPDARESVLEYLVNRTRYTIGEQVKRAHIIIVGSIADVEARGIQMNPEDARTSLPGLSNQTGPNSDIFIDIADVEVDSVLVGTGGAKRIQIIYAGASASGNSDVPLIVSVGDRGLMFLQEIPADAPYAAYLPQGAYQFAPGEKGVRNFLVTDYDDQGQPFTQDETAEIQETISAIEWFVSLPDEDPDVLRAALIEALDHPNHQIVRNAIRSLARQSDSNVGRIFKDKLNGAPENLRIRLMLGLWILGDKESAKSILEEFFKEHGKYKWLARWRIQRADVEQNQQGDVLYGPDPAELKGD